METLRSLRTGDVALDNKIALGTQKPLGHIEWVGKWTEGWAHQGEVDKIGG